LCPKAEAATLSARHNYDSDRTMPVSVKRQVHIFRITLDRNKLESYDLHRWKDEMTMHRIIYHRFSKNVFRSLFNEFSKKDVGKWFIIK